MEYDGLAAVDEDAVFEMQSNGRGEHRSFKIASFADQVIDGITMIHGQRALGDDGTFVKIVGDVMTGRADDFHAAFKRLVVGLASGEGRKEAVMNVDDPFREFGHECGRQDLHEPRKHDQINSRIVQQFEHSTFRSVARLGGHRDLLESQAVTTDGGAAYVVIANHDRQVC